MRVCANPHCSEQAAYNSGGRCMNCNSYLERTGTERPLQFVLWPQHGHPLLPTRALCKMTGITYRRIDHAIRTGWLKSTVEAKGSGYARGFTFDDATRAVVGFECAALAAHQRDAAVAMCCGVPRLRFRVGEYSELVIDVTSIRSDLLDKWPREYAMDLDDDDRAIVLGREVAA